MLFIACVAINSDDFTHTQRVLLCVLKQNVKPEETIFAKVVENGDHRFASSANECKDGGKLRPSLSEKPTAPVARTVAQTSKAAV